jgi:hypothetical protein
MIKMRVGAGVDVVVDSFWGETFFTTLTLRTAESAPTRFFFFVTVVSVVGSDVTAGFGRFRFFATPASRTEETLGSGTGAASVACVVLSAWMVLLLVLLLATMIDTKPQQEETQQETITGLL